MTPAVLLLSLAVGADPDAAFRRGVELRADAAAARPAFADAAAGYDALWHQGHHTADLALTRGAAHRLAGNLPSAVLAYHDGLAVAQSDRRLRAALEDARGAVVYPLRSDLEAMCRPKPVTTVGAWLSAGEGWVVAAGLWLAGWLLIARWAMTRGRGWLLAAAGCGLLLAGFGWLWRQDALARDPRPLAVVRTDTALRSGNADSYPARRDPPLPAGVEARVLTRRGGWVQAELAGGAVGWLPAEAVIAQSD